MTKRNRYADSQPGKGAAVLRGGARVSLSQPTLDSNLGSNPAIQFVERVTKGGPSEAEAVGLGISSRIHVFRKISPGSTSQRGILKLGGWASIPAWLSVPWEDTPHRWHLKERQPLGC